MMLTSQVARYAAAIAAQMTRSIHAMPRNAATNLSRFPPRALAQGKIAEPGSICLFFRYILATVPIGYLIDQRILSSGAR